MSYDIRFDFDCEGDPPTVTIVNAEGTEIFEVLEDPTCAHPSGWSQYEEDWELGPEGAWLLGALYQRIITAETAQARMRLVDLSKSGHSE